MKTNNALSPFQRALISSVLKDYDAALADAHSVEVSPELGKWMQNEVQASHRRRNAYRIARGILIAAIITALLAFSAMAVPAVRDAIIRFFLSEQTDHYAITFDPEQIATAPDEIAVYYNITYAPNDYTCAAENKNPATYITLWFSNSGQYIQYTQRIMPRDAQEDNWIGIDYNGTINSRVIEGYDVKIIVGKETNTLVWTNNAYIFTLELPIDLPEEEITKMFSSWVPIQ